MIKIKSYFNDEILDTVEYQGNFGWYLDSLYKEWRKLNFMPFSLFVDGKFVSPLDFDNTVISSRSSAEIFITPKGGVMNNISKILTLGGDFLGGWLLKTPRKSSSLSVDVKLSQSKLDTVDIKANQVKLGDFVPSGYGKFRRYPDYLNQPRRKFESPKKQTITALLCVGDGEYLLEDYKIGDTPISDLDGVVIEKFEPGETIPAKYADIWHTASEVGATSNGSAGIDMNETSGLEPVEPEKPDMSNIDPEGGYDFNKNTITRRDGSFWNERWIDGTIILINYRELFDVPDQEIYEVKGDFSFLDDDISSEELVKSGLGSFTILMWDYGKYGWGWVNHKFLPVLVDINTVRYISTSSGVSSRTLTLEESGENPGKRSLSFVINRTVEESNEDTLKIYIKDQNYLPVKDNVNANISYISGGNTGESEASNMQFTNLYQATPEGVLTDEIECDFFFPGGLIWAYRDPSFPIPFHFYYSVTVDIEVIDAKNNEVFVSETRTFSNNTVDQIGYTVNIKLPRKMEPLVRVRRRDGENILSEVSDKISWFGLKSKIDFQDVYPNWTTVGIEMQTGGKIAMSSESKINFIQTRILPELQSDGTWSNPVPTRSIPSAIKSIAESVGYSERDLDIDELLYLSESYWKPRSETFDYIFSSTTVKSAIDMVFGAGMSKMTIANGKIKPVRDGVRTETEQSYSAQNITSDITQSFKAREINYFDGVEIEYIDDITYDKKVIECLLPNSEGKKLRKIALNGVTNELRAWRIGMRAASEDRYINKDFSFSTEMDAFNSEYGSFIAIIDDIPQYGQSCQILEVEEDYVVLSEKPNEGSEVFAWRDEYGKYNGDFKINKIDGRRVYVDLPVKPKVSINMELPHAYLGKTDAISHKCLVDEISPNGTDKATIKASIYDKRVYAYDNSEIIK